jgi:hypothetical protein
MLECIIANHTVTFEELLEWPYRRVLKVFDAWQRRNAIDEVEKRKNLHIQALQSIIEWKDEGDQNQAIENVEEYYETLKDILWNPKKMDEENKEMRAMEDSDSFLKAGKRNLQKVVPPKFDGEDEISDLIS